MKFFKPISWPACVGLCGAASLLSSVVAALPFVDTKVLPVVTDNLPIIGATTGYNVSEGWAAGKSYYSFPLYAPYDGAVSEAWWDALVSEQQQARLPVIMMMTGELPAPLGRKALMDPWGYNPYYIPEYLSALKRAGVYDTVKFGCCPFGVTDIWNTVMHTGDNVVDFANEASWHDVWWVYCIKPWFDAIPKDKYHLLKGGVPIQFWGLGDTRGYKNQQGNISRFFGYLNTMVETNYGVSLTFEITGDLNCDTTLTSSSEVICLNPWFDSTTGYGFRADRGITTGTVIPGFDNGSLVISRKGANGTGANGDTFKAGLEAGVAAKSDLTSIEGWTDTPEGCASFRVSTQSDTAQTAFWDYPNQYVNIVRSFTDLRTSTLLLDAEACDAYNTPGRTGGIYRRSPSNLSIALKNGAAVAYASSAAATSPASNAFGKFSNRVWDTTFNAPGWIAYDYGEGNSNVVNRYDVTSSPDLPQRDPATWLFQGSNDNTTWTTLDSRTGQTFANRGQTQQYSISNTSFYRYYRLYISGVAGGSGNGIRLAQLSFGVSNSVGGGWVVSNTQAGDWLEWKGLTFSSGNYKFPVCYSSNGSAGVQLSVDGVLLGAVLLPSTGGQNIYQTASLGVSALAHGTHTLRLKFISGSPRVDWIFAKKYDALVSLKSNLNNCFVSAELGGNSRISAKGAVAGAWETFVVDDTFNGGVINSGDIVNLQVHNGLYVAAEGGGGGAISANRRVPGIYEKFTTVKLAGSGALTSDNQVAFKSNDGLHYMTARADGQIDFSGTTVTPAQTFTVNLSELDIVPAGPTNLTATVVAGKRVNLDWDDNSSGESGFLIQRSTDGLSYVPLVTVAANVTSYSDFGLSGGSNYFYRISATSATGNSDFAEASAETGPGVPASPIGLSAAVQPTLASATVRLDWNEVPGAETYVIKRSPSGNYSETIAAANCDVISNCSTQPCSEGGRNVSSIVSGSYTGYNEINLSGGRAISLRVASANGGGIIQVRLDGPTGVVVGAVSVANTGGWQTWTNILCPLTVNTGFHDLYLTYTGGAGYLFNVQSILLYGAENEKEAVDFNSTAGCSSQPCSEGGANLCNITNNSYTGYNNIDLTGKTGFIGRIASGSSGGTIQIRSDSPTGAVLGSCAVPSTGGWQAWSDVSCILSPISGVHQLFFVYTGASGYLLNLKSFILSSGPGSGFTTIGTTSARTFQDNNTVPGSIYNYVVEAANTYGIGSGSQPVQARVVMLAQADVGAGTGAGSYSSGVWTVTGSGGDIAGSSDSFHYIYAPLQGDGTVVAHIGSLTSSTGWAKSGVMMRESLDTGSPYAMMSITAGNGTNFQFRSTANATYAWSNRFAGIAAPQWVKLVREDSVITGYFSGDGLNWYQCSRPSISMSQTIYVGLCESHVSTATFDSVRIINR